MGEDALAELVEIGTIPFQLHRDPLYVLRITGRGRFEALIDMSRCL